MVLPVHRVPLSSFSILQFTETEAVVYLKLFFNCALNFTCLLFFLYDNIRFVFTSWASFHLSLAKHTDNFHKCEGDACSRLLLCEDARVVSLLQVVFHGPSVQYFATWSPIGGCLVPDGHRRFRKLAMASHRPVFCLTGSTKVSASQGSLHLGHLLPLVHRCRYHWCLHHLRCYPHKCGWGKTIILASAVLTSLDNPSLHCCATDRWTTLTGPSTATTQQFEDTDSSSVHNPG